MKAIIQKMGLDHVHHIFDVAMEIWEKEFQWKNELDDCLKIAMKRHREALLKDVEEYRKPPIVPRGAVKRCEVCQCEMPNSASYINHCVVCWRKKFLSPQQNN